VTAEPTDTCSFPMHLASPSGLAVQANANGSIRRIDCGDILVNLFLGNELEGGPANVYLRRLGDPAAAVPLLGPRSPARVRCDAKGLALEGAWQGIRFCVSLALAESAPAWFWHVELENAGEAETELDLIYAQDLGLAHYWAVRLNEYYVSQYLDHSPLDHPKHGWVLATRQNQSMGGRNPWCLIGSLRKGASFATDALQVHGLECRAGRMLAAVTDGLPGVRRQHEHGMAAIQDAPVRLAPGERTELGFFGWIEPDHPAATSAADLEIVDRALALPESRPPGATVPDSPAIVPSLFASAPLLEARDLTDTEIAGLFGHALREVEREDDRTLSFFCGERSHVALKAKELRVQRPHGQILRTGAGLTPDEASLTSTAWMAGVFHSMVTQGHVSINRLLSTVHGYLGLFRSHGQRLFVELDGSWQLLDVPSAFETGPQVCRWYYRHAAGLIRVESRAATDRHELTLCVEVLAGGPLRFLLSSHVAINGDDGSEPIPVRVAPDIDGFFIQAVPDCDVGRRFPDGGFRLDPLPETGIERFGGDELLFPDVRTRGQPFVCVVVRPATRLGFRLTGSLISEPEAELAPEESYWTGVTAGLRLHPPPGSRLAGEAARLAELLPWLAQNALVHYLSPRGLEQYSGGGWGTRDVTQGPVEMLLALGRPEPVRDLLVRVLKQQNPDGDWPQWFMFFDRERNIRPGDSHGDIVFWPLLALAQYLSASGDAAFLDEQVPFFQAEGEDRPEPATVREHLERALAVIANRQIPGTHLAAYGNGDWNDSLQPLDPTMRERLCSAWTVTLHFRTLAALAAAFGHLRLAEPAARFEAMAEQVHADFQRYLVVDGVLTGFAEFQDGQSVAYLLHPRDSDTGISFSLLAMVHALADGLFTPEQARGHLDLIRQHLLGPDGARLFDRPMPYRGGLQRRFQRAESSSFFGREIGLMYTHAHLRYAEALWRYGDAEGFFRALCLANPIGMRERIPAARLRQANCYYSSSDARFADRYQAEAQYDRLMRGEIPLDGGWRVYSSGAGIGMGLILRCLLGLRVERARLVVDPVIPAGLDGLEVETVLLGHSLRVLYRIRASGCGPTALTLNGLALDFERADSPYRSGAAEVRLDHVVGLLGPGPNRLEIDLGQ
jgi:1,2-beta-oligoglucan phosphorylase